VSRAKPSKRPFRFFDNREKYLLFITTCNEKQVTAQRIGAELGLVRARPPAFRLFDAGVGDATVLSLVMRRMHHRMPDIPFLIVGKESNPENLRVSLEKLPDRFAEHPQTVVVLTNMFYSEAPWLHPNRASMQTKVNWREVQLAGATAHDYDNQVHELAAFVERCWQTKASATTGNPLYVEPSVLVLYRADQSFALNDVIPDPGRFDLGYDLIVASQPYRSRLPAETKVRNVLAPLAKALAPGGRMITVQSTDKGTGMDIIRRVWPRAKPFTTPRQVLLDEMKRQLADQCPDLEFLRQRASEAEFRFHLQLSPEELAGSIGTSPLLAAWNAASYVAQIDDDELEQAMAATRYLDATRKVLEESHGLDFVNEAFVVTRRRD
jgi:hypothetical protein